MAGPIPRPAERQFSLALALAGTELGLTREQILTGVHGYHQMLEQKVRTGKTKLESLVKTFERDKDDLREAGIDIETVPDPDSPDDNKLTRYRLRTDAGREGARLAFTAAEAQLLEIAARVWATGALSGSAANSLAKLRALDVPMASPRSLAAMPRLRSRDHGFQEIADAMDAEQAIAFRYRKQLAEAAEPRRIEPLALIQFDGHWLVSGYDLDRGAERRFVLSRIEGPVRKTGPFGEGRRIDPDAAARALRALEAHAGSQLAEIALAPGGDAEVRLGRRGRPAEGAPSRPAPEHWTVIELGYSDIELFADELAGYGPELAVLGPPTLRAEVIRRLEAVVAEHGADEPGEEAR